MALQSLKDWFKFQIWPQAGGTTPELRDLSEIRAWLIDTADDPELTAAIEAIKPTAGAPTAPVAAKAILTTSGAVVAESTVTINGVTYTFVTALSTEPTVPNEILIGADEDASFTNLTAAIMGTAGKGTAYSTDTEKPVDITAVFNTDSATTITVTATTAGEIGNTYDIGKSNRGGGSISWDEVDYLADGVNGTVGVSGAIRFVTGELWISTDESTTAVSHWEKATLS